MGTEGLQNLKMQCFILLQYTNFIGGFVFRPGPIESLK